MELEMVDFEVEAGSLVKTEEKIHYVNRIAGATPHSAVGDSADGQSIGSSFLKRNETFLSPFNFISRHRDRQEMREVVVVVNIIV